MVLKPHISFVGDSSDGRVLPASSRVPSLSTDEVASVAPLHGVLAALSHGVHGRAAAIRPPGVEVPVVGADAVGSVLAPLQSSGHVAILALVKEVEGAGDDAGDSCGSEQKGFEGDHVEVR